MTQNFDPKLYDKRISERLIKKGLLSQQDFDNYLRSLPDLDEDADIDDEEEDEEENEPEEAA